MFLDEKAVVGYFPGTKLQINFSDGYKLTLLPYIAEDEAEE